jgi:hypothetical protein
MRRSFCLVIVAVLGLAACGQAPGVTSAVSPTAGSQSPLPTPSRSPAATPVKLASDSYPSAPRVNNGYVGNGVYGNAVVLSVGDAGAWYWDGKRWIVAKKPASSYFSSQPVFDPVLRKSVALTGGATGDGFTTWAWDGSSWSLLGAGPTGDGPPQLGFDPATNQLIAIVGNTDWTSTATWVLDGRYWKRVGGTSGPPARFSAGLAYDPMTRQLVLHGGILSQGAGTRVSVADTWTWDGLTWTEQHPTTNPPPGWDSLAYDPVSRQLILVNVAVVDEGSAPTEISMWSWAGTNWHLLNPHRLPAVGFWPGLTYDQANHQFLLFEATFPGSSGKNGSQTWVLAKNTWKRVG